MSDSDSDQSHTDSKPISRAESKLQSSIETYGTNSYYYAHSKAKEFVVPDHAIVVEGPGIITGGAPVKLAEETPTESLVARRRIEKYSWLDDGNKVRVYVDDPNILPLIADSMEAVSCSFDVRSMCLEVQQSASVLFCLDIPSLTEEIDPQESSFKVSLGKRVTVTLVKKNDQKWFSLKKN